MEIERNRLGMISVIIPSYNRAGTIERSARSVLGQTYRDIELIVVDDCSIDNTGEIVTSLAAEDARVRYVRHQKNHGACAARNTGILTAKGDFIAFQDSDDEWRAEKLEKQLEVMERYGADICYCRMRRHGYPAEAGEFYPTGLKEGIVDYADFIAGHHASTQLILAKAEVCREHLFDPAIKSLQDFDWCIRAGKGHRTAFADAALVDVFLQADSITSLNNADKNVAAYETLLKKHEDTAGEFPSFKACLLSSIGNSKTKRGDRSVGEFLAAYELTGNSKYLIKHLMYMTGTLQAFRAVKHWAESRARARR